MTSLYKILKSAKLGAGAAQDFHTAIMAQKMPFAKRSGAEHEYTGAVPVTFVADGTPLLDYLISGNTVQSGTPSPDSPIIPQGTGDLETSGAKAGQYKIPISSANTTTNIYLGEVQSTRQIKKLVFDGTENWRQSVNGAMYLSPFTGDSYKKEVAITSMNSHFAMQINTTSGTNQVRDNSSCFLAASGSTEYYIGARSYSTVTDFKTYLQQQYSAGTPVTVWYVLAEPTTGIVNEPLMKIGDYADTVSMEQAGVEIPTARGTNTLDVLTDVKPSEIYIKYKE